MDNIWHSYAINGSTGTHGFELDVNRMPELMKGEPTAKKEKKKRFLHRVVNFMSRHCHRDTIVGVDSNNIAEVGWGVIFAEKDPNVDAVEEQLKPLLDLRRAQAGDRFQIYKKERGFKKDQNAWSFLDNLGVGSGPIDPKNGVPFYLLLVGDPRMIPFELQYQLDLQFAVGRIFFDRLEGYRHYAETVKRSENGCIGNRRRVGLFAPRHPGDRPTELSHQLFALPLRNNLEELGGWEIDACFQTDATKNNLKRLIGGDRTPALLFTAGHGMMFNWNSERLLDHQGALLCQDWPGPHFEKRVPESFFFSGKDLDRDADLRGLIAFFFSCFGAGCPAEGDFTFLKRNGYDDPVRAEKMAPRDMIARLPMSMLAHPKGGALAVVAHVEQAWDASFCTKKGTPNIGSFQSVFMSLMQGKTLGVAMEHLNRRYGELGARLSGLYQVMEAGLPLDWVLQAEVWTAHNDIRNYIVIGDPAVRLSAEPVQKAVNEDCSSKNADAPLNISADSVSKALSQGTNSGIQGD